jgi:signal peptide peptidase SppA
MLEKEYRTEVFYLDPAWLPHVQACVRGERKIEKQPLALDNQSATPRRGIAVMNIRGPLIYSSSWLEDYGFISYETIASALEAALSNPSVATIIMRFESPGGTALGATELSRMIYDARERKRILAIADPYMFSAAYEIGSAASEVYMVESGMVGSVGAYSMHFDYSAMLEKDGVKVSIIKAGEKKAEGNPFEPLSDSAKKDMQEEVNSFYNLFVSDVARNRNVSEEYVKENFGKGGRVLAKDALSAGMVDGIITYKALLGREIEGLKQELEGAQNRDFVERNKLLMELEE